MKIERNIEGKPLEPWRQHLLDAAAYIQQWGHHKGSCYGNRSLGDGPACVGGALIRVGVRRIFTETSEEEKALMSHTGGAPIAVWNDRPETTKEMAVNALIGAALSHTE